MITKFKIQNERHFTKLTKTKYLCHSTYHKGRIVNGAEVAMGIVHLQCQADIQGAISITILKFKVVNDKDLDDVHGTPVLNWNEA